MFRTSWKWSSPYFQPVPTTVVVLEQPSQRTHTSREAYRSRQRFRIPHVSPWSSSPRKVVSRLPSRFGLSVETRRRYGWLRRMVFPGVRPFRAPIWCPPGWWRHARGREHCRGGPGSTLSGEYAPDSPKAEGSSIVDEPAEG